jgi:hypothetical protein
MVTHQYDVILVGLSKHHVYMKTIKVCGLSEPKLTTHKKGKKVASSFFVIIMYHS